MNDENQYRVSYKSVQDTFIEENLKESLLVKQRVEERSLSQPIQSTCLEQQQEQEYKGKLPVEVPGNIQQVSVDQQIFTYVRSDNFQGVSSLLGTLQSISAPPDQHIPSLINIVDANQNTLLHLAAFHSNLQIFEQLVDYQMKSFSYKSQDVILEWVNKTNNQHQTALHLACFRGNYEMVIKIIELGGDYMKKNAQGLTPLHVICQCDQIKLLVYFKEKLNIDINIPDNSQGTPLHQGSYAGHDRIVHLLLAWGANINAVDSEGFTPLHLAAVNGHYSIVRKLLVYGTKTNIKDKNGQTASQAAQENHQIKIAQLIKKKRRFSFFKYFGIKMLPQKVTIKLFYLKGSFQYSQSIFFLFLYILCTFYCLLFTVSIGDGDDFLKKIPDYLQVTLLGLSLLLWLIVCCKDPGLLQKREKGKFIQILQRQDVSIDQVCFECENVIPKRSKHCDTCNRCVSVYDHHCPWINNCVGANNHGIFYLFLIILWMTMLDFIIMTILCLPYVALQDFKDKGIKCLKNDLIFKKFQQEDIKLTQNISGIALGVFNLFFFILLTVLIFVQSKNLCSNRTTLERYAKPKGFNRTSSIEDPNQSLEFRVSIEGRAQTSWYANCLLMCCINARSKPYHYVYTDKNFPQEQRLSFE